MLQIKLMRGFLRVAVLYILAAFAMLTSPVVAQMEELVGIDENNTTFRDGLYADFQMFRQNRPIRPVSVDTEVRINDPGFYEKIARQIELVYYDENGVRQVTVTDKIWGYSQGGNIYIRTGSAFHKIFLLGRYSWFVAAITAEDRLKSSVRQYSYSAQSTYVPEKIADERNEYLVDLESNVFWYFDVPGLEFLLQNDPYLLQEFDRLNNRSKKRMKYIFLQRFNERNPLIFEESSVYYLK